MVGWFVVVVVDFCRVFGLKKDKSLIKIVDKNEKLINLLNHIKIDDDDDNQTERK